MPSEVHFLQLYLFLHFVKDRVIEDSHDFPSGPLEISQLICLVHLGDFFINLPVWSRVKSFSLLWLQPLEELLISFMGIKGVEDISFLT